VPCGDLPGRGHNAEYSDVNNLRGTNSRDVVTPTNKSETQGHHPTPINVPHPFVPCFAAAFYRIWEGNEIIVTAAGIRYGIFFQLRGTEDDAALNAGVEGIEGDARALSHARRLSTPASRAARS